MRFNEFFQPQTINEFARRPRDDDERGEDPYKYPKPEHYGRSIEFFGKFEADHFDKEDMNDATGEFKGYWGKTQIAYFKFDNPKRTGSDDPGMGWYYEPELDNDSDGTNASPVTGRDEERKQQELSMIDAFLKSGKKPNPGSPIYHLMKRHGFKLEEARRNPERNIRAGSGKYDLINYAEDIRDKDNWAVSMTAEPKLGINPQVGISEDTPKGIYFYPLNYVLGKIHSRKPLPWGDNYPYIQLFQYDRSGEMTQQTEVDTNKLKQALRQYCSDEVIQSAIDEPEYDGTPYWTIYDCLSRLGKSDETNVVRWNKVLRDLGFTSVYDPGKGWIAHNEPTQGVVLDPRIIKQHKTIVNRKESNVVTPAKIGQAIFESMDMELAANRAWQAYDPDGVKLRAAAKEYAKDPRFKPYMGKPGTEEIYDKASGLGRWGARQLSDEAWAWYRAQQPVKQESLEEGYGKYWCSTDKRWKERKGPKQTRHTEAANPAQQAAIAIAKKKAMKEAVAGAEKMSGLVDIPAFTATGTSKIVNTGDRIMAVVDVGGVYVPYYISTGEGGKASVPTGKWYPVFGRHTSGWLNKGGENSINQFYGSKMLELHAKRLNNSVGNILDDMTVPAMKKAGDAVINKDMQPMSHSEANGNPKEFMKRINNVLVKIGSKPFYKDGIAESARESISKTLLREFSIDDNGDGDEEDTLRKFARMWYNGDNTVQQQVEKILAQSGWEIGELESEEGGAFVIQSGDENGDSYIGFTAEDLTEGLEEASLVNALTWPQVVNKVNSAMKATGWKVQRMGEDAFMYTTKGAESDDQWYMAVINNVGNDHFSYALGTVEEGDPHIDDAFRGTLPNTEASVSELINEIREGFGLGDRVQEATYHGREVTLGIPVKQGQHYFVYQRDPISQKVKKVIHKEPVKKVRQVRQRHPR